MTWAKYPNSYLLRRVIGLDFTIIAPLDRAGIKTVGDLVAAMSQLKRNEVPGIGRKRLAILEDWVKEYTK